MIMEKSKLGEMTAAVESGLLRIKTSMRDAAVMEWFADDFSLRFCWSSNAIEGSTLSFDETAALLELDEVAVGHPYSEHRDAKSLYTAIRALLIPFSHIDITEEWIKQANAVICGTDGEYRTLPVRVGTAFETVHIPPPPEEVPGLMKAFVQACEISSDDNFELFERITLSHLSLERIHPFADGNGRVGRMILNAELINAGLLPITLTNVSGYLEAFKLYGKNRDHSKLMYEILNAELDAVERFERMAEKWRKGETKC